MSALITDVLEGTLTPGVTNAAVNAGGKLLKIVELQIRFGTVQGDGTKVLNLCESSHNGTPSVATQLPPKAVIQQRFQDLRQQLQQQEQEALAHAQ